MGEARHPNHPGELSTEASAAERMRNGNELEARARAIQVLQEAGVPFLVGGAYAYFDSSFPPVARRLLRLPWKRIFFAGEHTSSKWQGYMNGAVESGRRAAAEIAAVCGNGTS